MISNNIQALLRQNQATMEGSKVNMDYCRLTQSGFSRKTHDLAIQIADQYADRDDHVVYLYDVPEQELLELASSIMSHDLMFASEAMGADNSQFEKSILPALALYLNKPADRDLEIEYLAKLKSGIISYYGETIEQLLNDAYMEIR